MYNYFKISWAWAYSLNPPKIKNDSISDYLSLSDNTVDIFLKKSCDKEGFGSCQNMIGRDHKKVWVHFRNKLPRVHDSCLSKIKNHNQTKKVEQVNLTI